MWSMTLEECASRACADRSSPSACIRRGDGKSVARAASAAGVLNKCAGVGVLVGVDVGVSVGVGEQIEAPGEHVPAPSQLSGRVQTLPGDPQAEPAASN